MINDINPYKMSWNRVGISCLTLFTAPYHIKPHFDLIKDGKNSLFIKSVSICLIVLDLIPVIGLITAWMTSLYYKNLPSDVQTPPQLPPQPELQLEWLQCKIFAQNIKWEDCFKTEQSQCTIDCDTLRNVVIRKDGKILLDKFSNHRADLLNMIKEMKVGTYCQQFLLNYVCKVLVNMFDDKAGNAYLVGVNSVYSPRFIDIQMQNNQISSVTQWGYFNMKATEFTGQNEKAFSKDAVVIYIVIYPGTKLITIGSSATLDAIRPVCPHLGPSIQEEMDEYQSSLPKM